MRDDNSEWKQQDDEAQQFLTKEKIMQEKEKQQITPIGEAKWAHIHTPKTPFKDPTGKTQGDPKYQIDVVFEKDDPEWASWAKAVMEKLKSLPDQIDKRTGEVVRKQSPIKRELDEADEPTGRYYVTFRTSDKFKPGIFDRYGKVIPPDVLIGNGSKVRVNYIGNVYEAFGGGINFYLNAVQIVDLVDYKSRNAEGYGFKIEAESASVADPFADFKDDIPF